MKCGCKNKGELKIGIESLYSKEELPFVNHEPNECKCTNELRKYKKEGKEVWLCSNCVMGENLI